MKNDGKINDKPETRPPYRWLLEKSIRPFFSSPSTRRSKTFRFHFRSTLADGFSIFSKKIRSLGMRNLMRQLTIENVFQASDIYKVFNPLAVDERHTNDSRLVLASRSKTLTAMN